MTLNQSIVSRLMRRYYSQPQKDALDAAFCAHVRPGMKVLDAGCGRTRGCTRAAPLEEIYIMGVDIDPNVDENPRCNETMICDLSRHLPLPDASFDIVHCRWVIEHLENPLQTLREFARILKPGGYVLALTSNLFHYAMIAARITPYWFHLWWQGNQEREPFPTYYRANSKRKLHRLCKDAGLQVKRLELFEGLPSYLTRYWPLFLCGVLYERIVNITPTLECIRQQIILEVQKPSEYFSKKGKNRKPEC
jgi:ubiquinone/menaquinone biosynthesis C-methylase UbiE